MISSIAILLVGFMLGIEYHKLKNFYRKDSLKGEVFFDRQADKLKITAETAKGCQVRTTNGRVWKTTRSEVCFMPWDELLEWIPLSNHDLLTKVVNREAFYQNLITKGDAIIESRKQMQELSAKAAKEMEEVDVTLDNF